MPESKDATLVSVVVPTWNAGAQLDLCLAALVRSDWPRLEIIVVDDASDDNSAARIADRHGARYARLTVNSGPAIARNHGAENANGDVILFVDSDVVVHSDTVSRAMESLDEWPDAVAVFGSYDDQPADPSFLSQYRNLYHHWVHQQGSEEASTFWTGCGAMRRSAFEAVGGFARDIPVPAMEDIELGYRLKAEGYRIRLRKDMQCRHLKRWTLAGMLRTDIMQRGVPWVVLLLQHRDRTGGLNVNPRARLATLAAALLMVLLPLSLLESRLLWALPALVAVIVWAQWGFYRYLTRIRSAGFAVAVVPAQVVFFACCAVSVPLGALAWLRSKRSG